MGRFDWLFPKITNNVVKDLVRSEEDFIKELNRSQMYDKGVMNVETEKREKYAASTIRQKKKKARYKKTDFVTLRWTGDFYDSLKVLVFDKFFTINSDSSIWAKYLEPQDRFEKALGLTEDNKGKLSNRLRDKLIRWVKLRK